MVLFGGRAWFYLGGMHGFIRGEGACMVLFRGCMVLFRGGTRGFFSFFGYNQIRSMSGRYASYWNAFLFFIALNYFHEFHIVNNSISIIFLYTNQINFEFKSKGSLFVKVGNEVLTLTGKVLHVVVHSVYFSQAHFI